MDDITPAHLAEFAGVGSENLAEWGVIVVGYIDPNGESRFETHVIGEQRATTLVGVLELMKYELLMQSIELIDDDDLED